jgi:hypothetical protein
MKSFFLQLFSRIFGLEHVLDLVFPVRILRTSILGADDLELVQLALQFGLPFLVGV